MWFLINQSSPVQSSSEQGKRNRRWSGAFFRARRNPDTSPAYQNSSSVCQRNQSHVSLPTKQRSSLEIERSLWTAKNSVSAPTMKYSASWLPINGICWRACCKCFSRKYQAVLEKESKRQNCDETLTNARDKSSYTEIMTSAWSRVDALSSHFSNISGRWSGTKAVDGFQSFLNKMSGHRSINGLCLSSLLCERNKWITNNTTDSRK